MTSVTYSSAALRHAVTAVLWLVMAMGTLMLATAPARAEYGDVVLNKRAEKAGMRPVIFPH